MHPYYYENFLWEGWRGSVVGKVLHSMGNKAFALHVLDLVLILVPNMIPQPLLGFSPKHRARRINNSLGTTKCFLLSPKRNKNSFLNFIWLLSSSAPPSLFYPPLFLTFLLLFLLFHLIEKMEMFFIRSIMLPPPEYQYPSNTIHIHRTPFQQLLFSLAYYNLYLFMC